MLLFDHQAAGKKKKPTKSHLANKVGYALERRLYNADLEMNVQPTLPSSKYQMAVINSEKPSRANSAASDTDKSDKEQKS